MYYLNKRNYKIQNGFTLAEVLITLVIIGVIAAMTIPTLMKNTQKQELVTGLKKANSVLSQAVVNMARNNDSSPGDYTFLRSLDFINEFAKVANVIKICPNTEECFGSSLSNGTVYKRLNNTPLTSFDAKACITADGLTFTYIALNSLDSPSQYGMSTDDSANVVGRIWVDINGQKGPNILGRDLFNFFIINGKGIVPAGSDSIANCNTSQLGHPCAARVLKENAMNY